MRKIREMDLLSDNEKVEEDIGEDLPKELKEMSKDSIEKMIKRLDMDMQAEIEVVIARYTARKSLFVRALEFHNKSNRNVLINQ
mmetsp:Transcript_9437/g.1400  ORF Transcript_9437/g.1400 Transcript_9437/m.1400 type:complete len:84 (+) Transcript_9437:1123-1374(+)